MGINQVAFFFMFSLMLFLIASASDRSSSSGYGVEQSIRSGHGNGGGGGHGDGDGESSSSVQPGRPLTGGGTANTHNHHRNGAVINSPSRNSILIAVAISFSLYSLA